LGAGSDSAESELLREGAFVDLFQETGAEGVGYFVGGSDYGLEEGV